MVGLSWGLEMIRWRGGHGRRASHSTSQSCRGQEPMLDEVSSASDLENGSAAGSAAKRPRTDSPASTPCDE
eukprot:3820161-Alexandrium_andersonii.AAC.1